MNSEVKTHLYEVEFTLPMTVIVPIEARSEEEAADRAWEIAEAYVKDALSYRRTVSAGTVQAIGTLDGVGADAVKEGGSE